MSRFRIGLLCALSATLAACSGGAPTVAPGGSSGATSSGGLHHMDTQGGLPRANMDVALGDAAPRLGSIVVDKINLAVSEVDVVSDGHVVRVSNFDKPLVVDVFKNQEDPGNISTAKVAIGAYDHLRFVLDTSMSEVVGKDGSHHPISFQVATSSSSSMRAGKNATTEQVDATHVAMSAPGPFLAAGTITDKVQADFNAFESLEADDAGNVTARATLFAAATDLCGKVVGRVTDGHGTPVNGATVVIADAFGNVANTTNTDERGQFRMHTIPTGVYRVFVLNEYTTAVGQHVVAQGQSWNAGAGGFAGNVTVLPHHKLNLGTIAD